MIAPLLRSMVCPPNFSVLRREGSRRDFDAFGRSRPSCEGTTTAGGAPGSGENGGSRCERGPPLEIPPNGLRREPLRMYFYTRADNQASTLELLSKITSCSPVLATFSIHTTPRVSRRPSVVVMQAIEDWECHDTTVSLGHSRQRLFLPEALVWPRLLVEAGVLRDEAQKMALAKHEEMVEQFTPECRQSARRRRSCSGSGPRCERPWCRQLRTGSRTEHPAWRRDRRQALRAGRPRLRFAPAAHTSHRTAPG